MATRRMRFITWAKKDPEDETKIVYSLRAYTGEIMNFTSEDKGSFSMLERLREAWVEKIEKVNGCWHAKLYEEE